MAGMMRKKVERLHDPGVEPGLNVARDFANDVFALHEPA